MGKGILSFGVLSKNRLSTTESRKYTGILSFGVLWCAVKGQTFCKESRKYRVQRWGAGVETQKNVRGEIGGWGRVPFNEPYAHKVQGAKAFCNESRKYTGILSFGVLCALSHRYGKTPLDFVLFTFYSLCRKSVLETTTRLLSTFYSLCTLYCLLFV